MKKQVIILIGTVFFFLHSIGQVSPTYTIVTSQLQGYSIAGGTFTSASSINFTNTGKPGSVVLREKNKSARLTFKLDLGDNYIKQTANWTFSVEVVLSYTFNSSAPVPVFKTLTITNNSPEALISDNVMLSFSSGSPTLAASVISISTALTPTTGLLKNFIEANLRLQMTLEREYDVDVRLQSNSLFPGPPLVLPPSVQGRLATFSWQPNGNAGSYPEWELQIVRLHNSEQAFVSDADKIASQVDWTKALKVQTQSYQTSIQLNMAEGTGFYVWRVRPIGSYFEGGIANSENYGEWSLGISASSTHTLSKTVFSPTNAAVPDVFYMTDPDDEVNWIYSRVFTEGDNYTKATPSGVKTSEGMSYADGLLGLRQQQKYNSSEATNIVSQNVPDYSGRPALRTMPVPVNGGLTGYKLGLVKNTSGDLYTAKQFDDQTTFSSPDLVDDATNTPYGYYSGTVTTGPDNKNVSDAEGYLFKRTVYTSDGTNRLAEESGFGKAQALGTQSLGLGHTIRTLYGTPSDDELIWIFGEEAPLASSVIKTTTIDENNVVSITYTSKDGKTIATALESESTGNLGGLQTTVSPITIINSINENVSVGGKLVSSKRVTVSANSTTIQLGYSNSGVPGSATICPSGNCNLRLRFIIKDITNKLTYISDANSSNGTLGDYFSPTASFTSIPSGWNFYAFENPTITIAPSGSNNNIITLNAGEYVFTKELYSANSEAYLDSLADTQNMKIKPIVDVIVAKMMLANSTSTYTDFINFMAGLTATLNAYNSSSITSNDVLNYLGIDPADLPASYTVPAASEFSVPAISNSRTNPEVGDLQVVTGCCGAFSIPFPKKPECYTCSGHPASVFQGTPDIENMITANNAVPIDSIIPYGVHDFIYHGDWHGLTDDEKRSALHDLVDHDFISVLSEKMIEEGMASNELWKIAPGFSYESLNYMITNMLISQYFTGSAIEHSSGSGNWYRAQVAPGGGYLLDSLVSSLTLPFNYDCQKLLEAWTAAVELMGSTEVESDCNIVEGFNDEVGNPNAAQEDGENDENWPPWLVEAKNMLSEGIGSKINRFKNSDDGKVSVAKQQAGSQNVVVNFLEQAGYQFAAIIDGSTLPSYLSSTVDVFLPYDYVSCTVTPDGTGFYLTKATGSYTHTDIPLLFGVTSNTPQLEVYTCVTSAGTATSHELYYPYFLKPEWMFKYYVYNLFQNGTSGFVDDDDLLIAHHVTIDLARKYNEPYLYLDGSLSSGFTETDVCTHATAYTYSFTSSPSTSYTMASGYDHTNWNVSERLNFYREIAHAPKCPSTGGVITSGEGSGYYTDIDSKPACAAKADLITQAVTIIDDYILDCDNMAPGIKNALSSELTASCWTIVACRTSTTPGLITDAEIDIMVTAVINKAKEDLLTIKQTFTNIASPGPDPCIPPNGFEPDYGASECDLPSCIQVECKEIIFNDNNTLSVIDNRRLDVKYFSDCDQKIMDMIGAGVILPDVEPPSGSGCSDPLHAWQSGGCSNDASCSPAYEERTGCTNSSFLRYSKTYSVSASN